MYLTETKFSFGFYCFWITRRTNEKYIVLMRFGFCSHYSNTLQLIIHQDLLSGQERILRSEINLYSSKNSIVTTGILIDIDQKM